MRPAEPDAPYATQPAPALALPAPAEPPAKGPVEMVVLPVFRSWFLILLFLSLGAAGGVLFSLTQANEFTSEGKIQIRFGVPENVHPDVQEQNLGRGGSTALEDERHSLDTDEVREKVARIIGPSVLLAPCHPAADDGPDTPLILRRFHEFQSWWFGAYKEPHRCHGDGSTSCDGCLRAATQVLKDRTTLMGVRGSNLLLVDYKTHDPQLAQRVVATYLEVYKAHHLEKYSLESYVRDRTQMLDSALKESHRTAEALLDFRKQHDIADYNQQLTKRLQEESDLIRAVQDARVDLNFHRNELTTADGKLDTTEPEIVVTLPAQTVSNPEYEKLQRSLDAKQAERSELLRNYAEGSQRIGVIDAEIQQVSSALATTERFILSDPLTRSQRNPDYERLLIAKEIHEKEIRRLEQLVASKLEQLGRTSSRLAELRDCGVELMALERADDEARHRVDTVRRELYETEIPRQRQLANESNLKIVQAATLSLTKTGPKRLKFAVAGIAGGLFLGLGLAVARDFLDRTVRRPRDLEHELGIKVLGVVPYTGGWKRAWRNARSLPHQEVRRRGA